MSGVGSLVTGFQYTPYVGPLLVSSVLAFASGAYVWQSRERRATRWYVITMAVVGLWPLTLAGALSVTTLELKQVLFGAHVGFATLSGGTWAVFACLYSGRGEWASRSVLTVFWAVYAGIFAVVLTAPVHDLLYATTTVTTAGGWTRVTHTWGPMIVPIAVVGYGLNVVAGGLFLLKALRSRNVYRGLSVVLFLAGTTMWISNLVSVVGYSPLPHLMLAPMVFLLWGVLGLAVFGSVRVVQYLPVDRLFARFDTRVDGLVPLARDYVLEEIDSGVLVLDETEHVVDVNARGREMLGDPEGLVGRRLDAVVDVDEFIDEWDESAHTSEQVWFTDPFGDRRCYDVKINTIGGDGAESVGRAVVMNDITEQKQRERALRDREAELQTLKQVFSRIIRHNIRNDVNAIHGNAELIVADPEGDVVARAEQILEIAGGLATTSQKISIVDEVTGSGSTVHEYELVSLVDRSLPAVEAEYADADVRVDVPAGLTVTGNEYLSVAVENAIENALAHNDASTPVVEIEAHASEETVELAIRDNGPGIPAQELQALADREESALGHASGVGLWLIDWIVDNAGGSVTFENTDSGARTRLTLQRATDAEGSND